jgi:tRNA dimethylallyltransferase
LSELLAELDKPQHEGGCGDSGRLDKATQKALKQYVASLKFYSDDAKCEETLQWVKQAVLQVHGDTSCTTSSNGQQQQQSC